MQHVTILMLFLGCLKYWACKLYYLFFINIRTRLILIFIRRNLSDYSRILINNKFLINNSSFNNNYFNLCSNANHERYQSLIIRIIIGGQVECIGRGTWCRLIISGPPYIRSIGPVRAIAGVDTTIACPYSGYPITSVEWSRGGVALPLDIRHRVDSEGHLTIANVDPNDAGTYTCMVRARSGETASRDIRLTVSSEYLWIKMQSFFYVWRVSKKIESYFSIFKI